MNRLGWQGARSTEYGVGRTEDGGEGGESMKLNERGGVRFMIGGVAGWRRLFQPEPSLLHDLRRSGGISGSRTC